MAVQGDAPGLDGLTAPRELRALPQWLCWRYEENPGPGKPLKVPYYARGGRRKGKQGTLEDRSRLVPFEDAVAAAKAAGMTGVGFAPLPGSTITALDFDDCFDAAGRVPDEIGAITARTYSEYSPSGNGLRAFVRGDYGNRKSGRRGDTYGFETFASSGFVTFTGNVLPATDVLGLEDTIASVDDVVAPLCDARFGPRHSAADPDDPFLGLEKPLGLDVSEMEDLLSRIDPDMGRDPWIRVGMALHHECDGDDTGFDLWNDWSAASGKYPGDEALRAQWDSFERRKGERRRQVTMASVIKMAKEGEYGEGLNADDLQALMGGTPAPEDAALRRTPDGFDGRFPVRSAADLAALPGTRWWIKGVLPDADLVVLYGASGSGKTFVALDMAAALTRGIEWRGRRTRKARVTLIAAEGSGGIGNRLKAYCAANSIDIATLDISVITAAPNFLDDEDVTEVAKALAASGGCDVLVIDTFAQVTPGANENGAEDMGRALRNVRILRDAARALPVLVHHAGKDLSRGARGWSGIKAAADAEIEVVRHENGQREIRLSKSKDGEDGLRWGFRLEQIVLGVDDDGDAVTSCAAVEADVPAPEADQTERKNVQRYGNAERHVLEIIELEYAEAENAPFNALVEKCAEALPKPEAGKRDQRKYTIQRAIQSLAKRKDAPVVVEHGKVIFCT